MAGAPEVKSRVTPYTAGEVKQRIDRETVESLEYYLDHPEQIDRRIEELDAEWDIERWLQANAASLTLIGVGLGYTVSRKWLAFPAAIAAFLIQHSVQGWCPPVPLFRRLGVRTKEEIMREYCLLRALRGDFRELTALDENPERRREQLEALLRKFGR